jgi:hypothetical protein
VQPITGPTAKTVILAATTAAIIVTPLAMTASASVKLGFINANTRKNTPRDKARDKETNIPYTSSFGAGNWDAYLIKTDLEGNELWSKTFGGSGPEFGYSVQQTTDGGYILVGETSSFGAGASDVYLIKTDADGNELWSRTFGGGGYQWGHSVQQTTDGGYIIVGSTDNGVDPDVYLLRTDVGGNELWSKTFGGSDYQQGWSVQQTSDGGYIIVGEASIWGEGTYVYFIKTDVDGKELWSKTFRRGCCDYGASYGVSVRQTTDGGYIIVGGTDSCDPAGIPDVYLVKTDADGNELWSKTFGGSGSEGGYSVQQTTDGGYILVGLTQRTDDSDVYLIKTNAEGNVE